MLSPTLWQKFHGMISWHRMFHGKYPKTVAVTDDHWKKLCKEQPRLKRYKKVLGAKIKVIPPKIQGKSISFIIVDELEGDLEVNAPWSDGNPQR